MTNYAFSFFIISESRSVQNIVLLLDYEKSFPAMDRINTFPVSLAKSPFISKIFASVESYDIKPLVVTLSPGQ